MKKNDHPHVKTKDKNLKMFPLSGSPNSVMANVLDCANVVSSNTSHAIMFTFWLKPVEKV